MKINRVIFTAVIFVFCSCAGTQEKPLADEYWVFSRPVLFSPENLLSKDPAVKEKALVDYAALEEASKKKVLTYIAYLLEDELDASARHDILDLLRDIKAGPFIVAPLVNAYGKAHLAEIRTEISQFIEEYKPSKLELEGLIKLLDEKDWETRIKAIKVLATMKSSAGAAMPEIISVMHQTGASYGLYAECFDFAVKINSSAIFASAALDLVGAAPDIKESALRKLHRAYVDGQAKPADRAIALSAIVRVMYSGDINQSKLAREMLEKAGTGEAKAQATGYDAYKKMKVESMKAQTAINLKKKFAEAEDNLYLTLKLYYIERGRSDSVGSIYDPVKERLKP